jgi:hypothetical protein
MGATFSPWTASVLAPQNVMMGGDLEVDLMRTCGRPEENASDPA